MRDRPAGQELTVQYSFSRQIAEEKMEASSGTQLMRRDGGAGGPLVLAPVIGRYPCQECEARGKAAEEAGDSS